MDSQIVKWGNSQGVRLPKSLMQEAGLQVNEKISLIAREGKIIIQKAFIHKTLEERAAEYGGALGPYEEADWGEPAGRELW